MQFRFLPFILASSFISGASAQAQPPKYDFFQASKITREHGRFVRAIRVAGLTSLFRGKAPLTILAPTDAAWAALPSGVEKTLFLPQNKALLVSVVKYHLLPGRVDAIKLTGSSRPVSFKTLNGEKFTIVHDDRGWFFKPLTPISTRGGFKGVNLRLRNGYSHEITQVLLPPSVVRALPQFQSSAM